MATVADLMRFIGLSGFWKVNGLEVAVKIENVRMTWGMVQFEVSPALGAGKAWVPGRAVRVDSV